MRPRPAFVCFDCFICCAQRRAVYPLARNLVLLVVAIASEVIIRFALTGERADFSATLRDFAVRPLES